MRRASVVAVPGSAKWRLTKVGVEDVRPPKEQEVRRSKTGPFYFVEVMLEPGRWP